MTDNDMTPTPDDEAQAAEEQITRYIGALVQRQIDTSRLIDMLNDPDVREAVVPILEVFDVEAELHNSYVTRVLTAELRKVGNNHAELKQAGLTPPTREMIEEMNNNGR